MGVPKGKDGISLGGGILHLFLPHINERICAGFGPKDNLRALCRLLGGGMSGNRPAVRTGKVHSKRNLRGLLRKTCVSISSPVCRLEPVSITLFEQDNRPVSIANQIV